MAMKLTIGIFLFLGLLSRWLTNAGYPRLHFAGYFRADTATLNNDPYNFNIHTFDPNHNPPCDLNSTYPHCAWNLKGSNDFQFVNCFVKKVCYKDGECSKDDALVGKRIIGSDDTVAGKMVILDPLFQLETTQLFGLYVGVDGAFQGKFQTNTVFDIWKRCPEDDCPDNTGRSGYYSSVLKDVTWMEEQTGSRFINELRYYQQDNSIVNIKFTLDIFQKDYRRPGFALGRVVGTISAVDESLGLMPEFNRMLWGQGPKWLSPDQQQQSMENCMKDYCNAPFYVDNKNKKVIVDLSNSLRTNQEGNFIDQQNLFLVILQDISALTMAGGKITDCSSLLEQHSTNLGHIPYTDPGFLMDDTGMATFDLITSLTHENPLMIVREEEPSCPSCPKQCTPILVEHLDGLYVGPAEDRIFRIPQPKTEMTRLGSEEDTGGEDKDGKTCWSLTVFAAKFGEPKAGVPLSVQPLPDGTTGVPEDAIEINAGDCRGNGKAATNAYGVGTFHFKSDGEGLDCSRRPPGTRDHLFGQLYTYDVTLLEDTSFPPNLVTSTHLYCKVEKKAHYEWDDIYPILKVYENLFPVMKTLFNLASEEDIKEHSRSLSYALGLPIENPNHMPVTRDLSPAKRDMILEWLKSSTRSVLPQSGLHSVTPRSGPPPNPSLEDVKENLKAALKLEWATIPPYLSAYYSLKDGYNKEIARLLKSIVVQEMIHLSMVANILNFVGEAPILNDNRPQYPMKHLPGGVNPGLIVPLSKFSLKVTHDVFMAIETPECDPDILNVHEVLLAIPPRLQPEEVPQQCLKDPKFNCHGIVQNIKEKCMNESYTKDTIGALYIHKILCPMLKLYKDNPGLFTPTEENLKKQVPIPFCVLNICSMIEGIKYIVAQGEGSDPCNPFFEGELSHYYKFKEIWKEKKLIEITNGDSAGDEDLGDVSSQTCDNAEGCDNTDSDNQYSDTDFTPCGKEVPCTKHYTFSDDAKLPFDEDGVWPTVPNPSTSLYPQGSRVRILSDSFNKKYTNLMNCLNEAYNGKRSLVIAGQCYALMTSLTVDAKRLVQTPMPDGGFNGAPTFEFYPPDD